MSIWQKANSKLLADNKRTGEGYHGAGPTCNERVENDHESVIIDLASSTVDQEFLQQQQVRNDEDSGL